MGLQWERRDEGSFQGVKKSLYFDQGGSEVINIYQAVRLRLYLSYVNLNFSKMGKIDFPIGKEKGRLKSKNNDFKWDILTLRCLWDV